MSHAKQKGKLLEDWVADQIVVKGIDPRAHRDGASGAGNREKGDISTTMMICGQNAGIECKNHKTLALPDWWRQTKQLESLGREPMLVFKFQGDSLEDTKVVMYLDTILELIKNQRGYRENTDVNTKSIERDRAIEQIINAVKILEK